MKINMIRSRNFEVIGPSTSQHNHIKFNVRTHRKNDFGYAI
jgi:hypothetical protein